jgi:Thiamine pyrophosphate enzyme, C-terminal TPP binding domain
VICLAGDGGFSDRPTTVQEHLPIKIVVYDNGKLGFVDLGQKAAGLLPVCTLEEPRFRPIGEGQLVGRNDALINASSPAPGSGREPRPALAFRRRAS